jgi:hypothetical protein
VGGGGIVGGARALLGKKGRFMRTVCVLAVEKGLCVRMAKKCANTAKKLLPVTDLTIIINGLVVRINNCRSRA